MLELTTNGPCYPIKDVVWSVGSHYIFKNVDRHGGERSADAIMSNMSLEILNDA